MLSKKTTFGILAMALVLASCGGDDYLRTGRYGPFSWMSSSSHKSKMIYSYHGPGGM